MSQKTGIGRFFRSSSSSCPGLAFSLSFLIVLVAFGVPKPSPAAGFNVVPVTTVSAASYDAKAIAPESIVASFGTMLATTTAGASDADPNAPGIQLPTTLAGTTVEVNGRRAGLFFVSPAQINYVIPAATEIGPANVAVRSGDGTVSTGTVQVSAVAPAVFTANSNGQGVPAAALLRLKTNNAQSYEPVAQFDALLNRFITRPVNFGTGNDRVFLILFLSGLRRAADPNRDGNLNESVRVVVGGMQLTPLYAGRQADLVGLDQVNVELPSSLIGRGIVNLTVTSTSAAASNAADVEMAAALSSGRAPRAFDNSVNTDEDAGITIALRGDDAGGRSLRYIVTRLPKRGRLSGSAPNLTYTAEANYNGADGFTFKVNNGVEDSSEAGVNINIRPVNDAPVLTVPSAQTVSAGQPLSFTVSATDVDAEDTLSLSVTSSPDGATFTKSTATSWKFDWTPTFMQAGAYTINCKVSDNGSPSLTGTKTIVITVLVANPTEAKWGKTSGPEGGYITSFVTSGTNLFSGNYGNGVFLSTDGGRSWTAVNSGLTTDDPYYRDNLTIYTMAVSGNNLFIGTGKSGVFRSINNGQSWVRVSSGLTNNDVRALIVSGTTIFAGTDGGLFRSTNNGETWTAVNTGLTNVRIRSFTQSGANLFAGSFGGGVFRSSNNGDSWVATSTGLTNLNIRTMAAKGQYLFAGTGLGGVFRSSDNGVSWMPANNGLPQNAYIPSLVVSGSNLFAGDSGGGVFLSTNDGANWIAVNGGLTDLDVFSMGINGATLLVGTYGSGGFRSTNNGQSWTPINAGVTNQSVFSFAVSGNNLFAGTFRGGVFRSANNGQSWMPVNVGLRNKEIMALVANGSILLAGAGTNGSGTIFRSNDNGDTWTQANNGLSDKTIWAFAVNGTHIFAATENYIFRSSDQGLSWVQLKNGLTSPAIYSVVVSGTTVFAGTLGGGVFRSTDNGQNWMESNGGNMALQSAVTVLAVNGSTIFAGSPSRGVFRSTDQGRNWTKLSNGLPPDDQFNFPFSIVVSGFSVVIGYQAGVLLSSNNGDSWQAINNNYSKTGAFTLTASGANLFAGTNGDSVFRLGSDVQSWTDVNTGLSNKRVNSVLVSGSNLFAGMLGDGVFRSADQGRSWTKADTGLPPNVNAFTLAESGANLFVGAFGDGVFRSTNQGQSWTHASTGLSDRNVNGLLISGSSLFAATNGGVFRSTDQGQSWILAGNGLTGLRVLALCENGGTLYAGTDGSGIFVSTNNGQSWSAGNVGLGNLDVRSLIVSGTSLFAGTLSGGIFRSTDGGRSWTAVNKDLPPRLPVFSFAVSGTKLYAGTVYGVFVSTDNGENWKQINAGLSNLYVTSLALSGKDLLAGTQGGGVFVSRIPD